MASVTKIRAMADSMVEVLGFLLAAGDLDAVIGHLYQSISGKHAHPADDLGRQQISSASSYIFSRWRQHHDGYKVHLLPP